MVVYTRQYKVHISVGGIMFNIIFKTIILLFSVTNSLYSNDNKTFEMNGSLFRQTNGPKAVVSTIKSSQKKIFFLTQFKITTKYF